MSSLVLLLIAHLNCFPLFASMIFPPTFIGALHWSLITVRLGLQNGKIAGAELCLPPPPQDRVKLFPLSLLKSGNFLRPLWLKLQLSYCIKTTPKHFCASPSIWLNIFQPPLFSQTSLPPSFFVAPTLPAINDQSLSSG